MMAPKCSMLSVLLPFFISVAFLMSHVACSGHLTGVPWSSASSTSTSGSLDTPSEITGAARVIMISDKPNALHGRMEISTVFEGTTVFVHPTGHAMSHCLKQYTTLANITVTGKYLYQGLDQSEFDMTFTTTKLNVPTHWGLSGRHPHVKVTLWKQETCPPPSWDLFELFEHPREPLSTNDQKFPICSYFPDPASCTSRVDCEERCESTWRHTRKLMWVVVGVAAALTFLAAIGALCVWLRRRVRQRHQAQQAEPKTESQQQAPQVVSLTPMNPNTTANLDGAADFDGETLRDHGSLMDSDQRSHLLGRDWYNSLAEQESIQIRNPQAAVAPIGLGGRGKAKVDEDPRAGRRGYNTGSEIGTGNGSESILRARD